MAKSNNNNQASAPMIDRATKGQTVLVLQGGGALGAYQGGVYQALDEAGIHPDWVVGTSIGAINAAIIAGNAPENRLEKLREFWRRVQPNAMTAMMSSIPIFGAQFANAATMFGGVPNFFVPNQQAFMADNLAKMGLSSGLTPQTAGYYSTAKLEATLTDLIDLDILAEGKVRLTVGAANVRTADMHYFDSKKVPVGIKHVMASGALPPAFPAVEIDGELYWDGGIISNTPVEAVFDDNPRSNGVVFAVHIWRPSGPDPDTMTRVMSRQKDLQYASRATSHIARQKQIHQLRHVVSELVRNMPEAVRATDAGRELASFGCDTCMHVVRLVAPPLAGEDHTKDIDFSAAGIRARWEAGYSDTRRVIEQRPWDVMSGPLDGFILHETEAGEVISHY